MSNLTQALLVTLTTDPKSSAKFTSIPVSAPMLRWKPFTAQEPYTNNCP